jgi:hypothetical protein
MSASITQVIGRRARGTHKQASPREGELNLDLAAWAHLRRLLRPLLDRQKVRRRGGADVGQQGAAAQQQELEQKASLGERPGERLEELALQTQELITTAG